MERMAYKFLQQWKQTKYRKPLICRGARQVGKTYLIETFAQKEFPQTVSINFEQEVHLQKIFEQLNPTKILKELALLKATKIIPGKCLLFLDEIQACPQALRSLRYFYEELPSLHIIAAGSLLDLTLSAQNISMPVGRVEYLYLHPLSFLEFLKAFNEHGLIDYLQNLPGLEPLAHSIAAKFLQYLKEYFFIGGMPEVVKAYVAEKDYLLCNKIQGNLIESFRDDFAKYAKSLYWDRLTKVFYTVPKLLGQKFKYVNIDQNYKARDLQFAFELLEKAQIIKRIKATAGSGLPFEAEASLTAFKPLFLDIGLAQKICGLSSEIILNNTELINKGGLAEQFVGQELLAYAPSDTVPRLYYWKKENGHNSEVDYLFAAKGKVIPLEVKTGSAGSLKSLHQFVSKYQSKIAVKITQENIELKKLQVKLPHKKSSISFSLLNVPLYAIWHLANLLSKSY